MTARPDLYPLTRRIRSLADPDERVLELLEAYHGRQTRHARNTEFSVAGVVEARPSVVVSGWMLRTQSLNDGRRQVLGYVLPGDVLNFSLHSAVPSMFDVECVTDVVVADISDLRRHVLSEAGSDPVAAAVWLMLAVDDAIALNSVARLTRQSAYDRVAHFLLDLKYRLSLIGVADRTSFELPLTQQAIGEALGLSVVHVNRVLMQLRRDGMVERNRRTVVLPQPQTLARRVEHSTPTLLPEQVRLIEPQQSPVASLRA